MPEATATPRTEPQGIGASPHSRQPFGFTFGISAFTDWVWHISAFTVNGPSGPGTMPAIWSRIALGDPTGYPIAGPGFECGFARHSAGKSTFPVMKVTLIKVPPLRNNSRTSRG